MSKQNETVTIDDILAATGHKSLKCRNCGTSHSMREVIAAFFAEALVQMKAGKSVYIHGFARMSPKTVKGRTQKVGLDTIAQNGEGGERTITFGDRTGVKFKLLGSAKTEMNAKPAKPAKRGKKAA